MRTIFAATLFAAALTTTASAEDKPAPQVAEIKKLIGNWSGKGSITSEGKKYAVTMNYECVESTGGAGVRCKSTIVGLPGFTYQFDDLWGFSTTDNLVHWYTVTNAGEVHDHRGHLDATSGYLAVEQPVDGKLLSEQITIKRGAKTFTMSWVTMHGLTQRERGEIKLETK
ncbi:MAG TPA: hypothetical protein VL326_22455 [Kofleriaceae bacterium]|jgi:hypothetical protein|nr:hypothetical protein [Kofleriaceae bacterium]